MYFWANNFCNMVFVLRQRSVSKARASFKCPHYIPQTQQSHFYFVHSYDLGVGLYHIPYMITIVSEGRRGDDDRQVAEYATRNPFMSTWLSSLIRCYVARYLDTPGPRNNLCPCRVPGLCAHCLAPAQVPWLPTYMTSSCVEPAQTNLLALYVPA